MNTLKLCDAVDWQISLSGMGARDAETVKTCVARYTRGEGVCDGLKYVFHRVCNAVKYILGEKTDWQKAEDVIESHIFSFVPAPFRFFSEQVLHDQVHFVAGKTLGFLVWENEKKLNVPPGVKKFVESKLEDIKGLVSETAQFLFQRLSQREGPSFSTWARRIAEKSYQFIPVSLKAHVEGHKELYQVLFKEGTNYLARTFPQYMPKLNYFP